jgi:hypothetical protein
MIGPMSGRIAALNVWRYVVVQPPNLVPLPGNKQRKGGVHAQRLGKFWHTRRNPMRRWIDELSFCMRVVLVILVILSTIAVMAWGMIELALPAFSLDAIMVDPACRQPY